MLSWIRAPSTLIAGRDAEEKTRIKVRPWFARYWLVKGFTAFAPVRFHIRPTLNRPPKGLTWSKIGGRPMNLERTVLGCKHISNRDSGRHFELRGGVVACVLHWPVRASCAGRCLSVQDQRVYRRPACGARPVPGGW